MSVNLLIHIKKTFVFLLVTICMIGNSAFAEGENFPDLLAGLNSKSFKQKIEAASALVLSDHEQVQPVLGALLKGDLFYIKKDQQIVIAEKQKGGYEIFSAESGESLGVVKRREVKKIKVNNKLR